MSNKATILVRILQESLEPPINFLMKKTHAKLNAQSTKFWSTILQVFIQRLFAILLIQKRLHSAENFVDQLSFYKKCIHHTSPCSFLDRGGGLWKNTPSLHRGGLKNFSGGIFSEKQCPVKPVRIACSLPSFDLASFLYTFFSLFLSYGLDRALKTTWKVCKKQRKAGIFLPRGGLKRGQRQQK